MADDDLPFYHPAKKLPIRVPKPGEHLWTERVNNVTWSCELRSHGEWGTEAQILRDGDLVIGRRFLIREEAIASAEQERNNLGALDWSFTIEQD
jgi:hypothetical protein